MLPNIKLINGEKINLNNITNVDNELLNYFNDPTNKVIEILNGFENSVYKDFISTEDKSILDLGANIGLFSLYVSPNAQRILSLEPAPKAIKIFRKLCKNYKNIELVPMAIADYSGKAKLFLKKKNSTQNKILPAKNLIKKIFLNFISSAEIETISFQDFFSRFKINIIDFCKIDIEGSEFQILNNKNIKYFRPYIKKIYLELHRNENRKDLEYSKNYFKALFVKNGYKVEDISHDSILCF